jgi:chemotaxis protein CheX
MNSLIASLSKEDLNQVASEVWSSMANITLSPAAESHTPDKTNGYVTSSVQILGAWEGAVLVDMDHRLAMHTTAQMLMMDEAEVSIEELHDAAGELANMTGGGFKALVAQPCSLSLPSVASGSDYTFQICHGVAVLHTSLTSEFGSVSLTVLERQA